MLFTIFMWRRLNKWWRPFLVAYPIFMAFTLVYTAEHFFSDVPGRLAGRGAGCVAGQPDRAVAKGQPRPPDTLEPLLPRLPWRPPSARRQVRCPK